MNNLLSGVFGASRDEEKGETEMVGMDTQKQLAQFFEEVNQVKEGMEKIKALLAKLNQANEESLTVHKAASLNALRTKMDADIAQVLKLAKGIKTQLEDLDQKNIANRSLPGCGEGTSVDRTRISVTVSLKRKLKDLMGDFQALREKIMSDYKDTVQRRYYTITGEQADEETVERIIETGECENFLQKAIQEQGRGQVIETIREIHERHDAVKVIQKNLYELLQIFKDMAVLVEDQGEQLNDIEAAVGKASSFVEHGTAHLVQAKKRQRSSRKCTCIAIILLLIILLIVVLVVLKVAGVI